MRVVDTSARIEGIIRGRRGRLRSEFPPKDRWVVPTIVQFELAKWLAREAPQDLAKSLIAFSTQCIVIDLDTAIALRAAAPAPKPVAARPQPPAAGPEASRQDGEAVRRIMRLAARDKHWLPLSEIGQLIRRAPSCAALGRRSGMTKAVARKAAALGDGVAAPPTPPPPGPRGCWGASSSWRRRA